MQSNQKEVLLIAQEECAEVTQAISKVFRFGLDESYNNQTNRERLTEEVGDLMCMLTLIMEMGIVDPTDVKLASSKKRNKLKQWSTIFKEAA